MEKDLAQFIAEELFDSNRSAISAIADMIRPILRKWELRAEPERCPTCAKVPANWFEDSSLETWFPLTAEELKRTKQERDEYKEAAYRLENTIRLLRHERAEEIKK